LEEENQPDKDREESKEFNVPDNILCILAGKGGVGKTTVAINLARVTGSSVLDVDVEAPNAPELIQGETEEIMHIEGDKIKPAIQNGIEIVSLSYDLPNDTVIMREGGFKHNLILNYIKDTEWSSDTLIVDTPPGSGEEPRAVLEALPGARAVIVTTSHKASVMDAKRSKRMLKELGLEAEGVVSNMTHFICPNCGKRSPLLNDDVDIEKALDLPVLANILFSRDNLTDRFLDLALELDLILWNCPICGKECKNERGVRSHINNSKDDDHIEDKAEYFDRKDFLEAGGYGS